VTGSSFTNNSYGLYFYGYGTSSGTVTDTDMSANDNYGLYTDMYEDGMDLVVSRSTMNDNDDLGVYLCDMSGTLLIEDSTVDGNTYAGIDGYIYSEDGGQFTLSGSTVSNNGEGGIELDASDEDATFTMINSTVSGNDGDDYGSAAVEIDSDDYDGAGVFIRNSTITANTAVWAGLYASYIPVEISHSIISGNEVGAYADVWDDSASDYDISWSIVDINDEIVEGSGVEAAAYTEGDGVVFSTEPGLGALADNGGPTLTHLPLDDSLALNTGNPDAEAGAMGVPDTDQRGLARVSGTAIEIGAVEVQEEDELAATGAEAGLGVAGGLTLLTLGLGLVGIRLARRRQLA
jgi:parallel beta-helix repeat protein